MNPFITSGYVSPEYFCNRETESKRLKSAIINNSNLTLLSIRRIGKTGLIKHVFYSLETKKSNLVYVDIASTNSFSDFISLFSQSILRKFQSIPSKFFKELGLLLRNVRPIVKFDQITGEPQISLTIAGINEFEDSLVSIFEYIKKQSAKSRVCIAIDEFQQITTYPEKNVEAILRSHIQQAPLASFIFSGSKNKIMQNIFFDSKRPFYQSSELMSLKKIKANIYKEFIKEKFKSRGIIINDESADFILDWSRVHTYYVQLFCYRLYSLDLRKITLEQVIKLSDNILDENESIYLGYRNFLSEIQWKLLQAIAKEGYVSEPTGGKFLQKYSFGNASTIKYTLNKLIEMEMVYEESNKYYVYDVFFSRWLEKLPNYPN